MCRMHNPVYIFFKAFIKNTENEKKTSLPNMQNFIVCLLLDLSKSIMDIMGAQVAQRTCFVCTKQLL